MVQGNSAVGWSPAPSENSVEILGSNSITSETPEEKTTKGLHSTFF